MNFTKRGWVDKEMEYIPTIFHNRDIVLMVANSFHGYITTTKDYFDFLFVFVSIAKFAHHCMPLVKSHPSKTIVGPKVVKNIFAITNDSGACKCADNLTNRLHIII